MIKPLSNFRILDLTRVLSGPFCTGILADLGAEVIKIEGPGPGGDLARLDAGATINGESHYFMSLNRGKKSLKLDLKKKKGIDIFKELVKNADVVIENNRYGVVEKLGISYEEIKKINKKIIYASISGFGRTSPFKRNPAYDIIAQAMGGLMSINGQQSNPPTKVGISLGDTATSLYTAIGIITALFVREKYGIGQYIEVSMVDSIFSLLEMNLSQYIVNKKIPKRIGSRHPTSYPFDVFKASDGFFVIGTATDRAFLSLCKTMGMTNLSSNDKYSTDKKRGENWFELKIIIEEWASHYKVKEIVKKLIKDGIPASPVLNIKEIAESQHIKDREMLVEVDHPIAGKIKVPGQPIKFSETPSKTTIPSPVFGQHTEEILKSILKYSDKKIKKLKEMEVV